jgi:cytochrome oxidase assembly protein ShyY1
LWTLRQRRYAALAVTMLFIAMICVGAGTFEIHRYNEKVHDNGALRDNAHAAAVPLTSRLVPLVGHGRSPEASAILYRTVTATGRYLPAAEAYVAGKTQAGRQGFYVLTPLRTAAGVLPVVRGFVAATAAETRPAQIPAPPRGNVEVTGWLQPAQTSSDRLGQLGHGEITSINPAQQARRLGAPTYDAYLALNARAPGAAGLRIVSRPGLSNPTGGAAEWQLLSYVVQWYAFAALALLAPFLFSRAEVREARRRFLGIEPGTEEFDHAAPTALGAIQDRSGAELAVPGARALARRGESAAQRWERAARLADRYGRSLGPDGGPALAQQAGEPSAASSERAPVLDSSAAPHRSEDDYHGSYNDFLWQLALADGEAPAVDAPELPTDERDMSRHLDAPRPRPIERDRSAPHDGR